MTSPDYTMRTGRVMKGGRVVVMGSHLWHLEVANADHIPADRGDGENRVSRLESPRLLGVDPRSPVYYYAIVLPSSRFCGAGNSCVLYIEALAGSELEACGTGDCRMSLGGACLGDGRLGSPGACRAPEHRRVNPQLRVMPIVRTVPCSSLPSPECGTGP